MKLKAYFCTQFRLQQNGKHQPKRNGHAGAP